MRYAKCIRVFEHQQLYNQYFEAQHSVLVYPQVYGLADLPPTPFARPAAAGEQYFCRILFLEIARNGRLNKDLGAGLIASLLE